MPSYSFPVTRAGETAMPPDEELMRELAAGREEAIGPLYARYAPLLFGMAAQALDRATAEEIVQDVFLATWKNASSFDPSRGPLRPWLLQIAHFRIANELRRRTRRPNTRADVDGTGLEDPPDPAPDQTERIWAEHRRAALQSALERLPARERQALRLAYFEDLSHGEVARALALPLGTAKSRIRAGMASLRAALAPIVAGLLVVALAGLAIRIREERASRARDERALAMLTSSDAETIRLSAAPDVPQGTHGNYRSRPGGGIAVVTFSNFAPAPAGRVYRVWTRFGDTWTALGTAVPDAAGRARVIAEGDVFSNRPDEVRVTLETERGSATPSGPPVVSWLRPRGPAPSVIPPTPDPARPPS